MASECLVSFLTARSVLFRVGCSTRSARTFRSARRWFPWKRSVSCATYSQLGKLLPTAVMLC
jgi:hypothetical protein